MRNLSIEVRARRDQKLCWSIVRFSFANGRKVSNYGASVKPAQ
ncbi:hypothetical protein RUA4292_01663 [Ruegeria atlantica]|uniref:Uncharacterized protein n=1 Tax=Ruegeria atlantica TaxID=81569 RepID=A0A0N7LQA7_9RHOB|nr:hypothetical protein RUA4292_01663 [Ruegeria atlantica]